jgi:hypothetical protein
MMDAEGIRFMQVGGYRLGYLEQGTRLPALLLIHGSMSDYRSWLHQMDAFGARHRTLVLADPGDLEALLPDTPEGQTMRRSRGQCLRACGGIWPPGMPKRRHAISHACW